VVISSLEAPKNLAVPETKVLRGVVIDEIPTGDVVSGDIIILETGAIIPAGLRFIEAIIASACLAMLVLLIPLLLEAFSLTAMDREHWLAVY
jgi:magnesium-transporting ATPase (P-type)